MKFSPIVITVGLASLSLVSAEENWPSFRGPGDQGHAKSAEVPLSWSATDNIRWAVPIAGKAWSSPIAVGDRAYITTAIETANPPGTPPRIDPDTGRQLPDSTLSLRALAIDLKDGKTVWDTEVFATPTGRIHRKNSHASPTPVYEDGSIYVHYGPHGTARIDATTGAILWAQNSLPYPPVHGSGSSPILCGDRLIYSADGKEDPTIVALNKADGSVAWKTPRQVEVKKTFSFCTPLLIEAGGQTQIISPCSGGVIAYAPEDGAELWRCRWGEGYSVTPRPIYHHGLIYASSGFDRATAYAIRPGESGDITDTHIEWTYTKTVPRESSFIIVGDEFYMNDDKGVLTCLDAKTGDVHYVERLSPEGGYSAAPVYASGHLFFTNGEGVTTVVKPGTTFEKISENRLDQYGLSSLCVLSDGFLHRTETQLIRIGK